MLSRIQSFDTCLRCEGVYHQRKMVETGEGRTWGIYLKMARWRSVDGLFDKQTGSNAPRVIYINARGRRGATKRPRPGSGHHRLDVCSTKPYSKTRVELLKLPTRLPIEYSLRLRGPFAIALSSPTPPRSPLQRSLSLNQQLKQIAASPLFLFFDLFHKPLVAPQSAPSIPHAFASWRIFLSLPLARLRQLHTSIASAVIVNRPLHSISRPIL